MTQPDLNVACPCGSGRPFANCHGVEMDTPQFDHPTSTAPIVAAHRVAAHGVYGSGASALQGWWGPPSVSGASFSAGNDALPPLAPAVVSRKLDLACGQNCRAGFEGVDRWDGAQHIVNLFRFPWPFADSSVAELHCSHFVEHIPMIEVDRRGQCVPFGEGVDLMFRFFDECFRILVPGGWMEVITPCARHNRAYQDPTHRRFIVAETFLYLNKEFRDVNKLDHYGGACDFGVNVNPIVDQALTLKHPEVSGRMMQHEWNRVLDWQAKLQSKKPTSVG